MAWTLHSLPPYSALGSLNTLTVPTVRSEYIIYTVRRFTNVLLNALSVNVTLSPCCVFLVPQDLAEIVGALASLIDEVQEDVKNCKTLWNRVFVR